MGRQVVHDDHIARPETGHEDLIHVSLKRRIVDRPIEDRGRPQTVQTERRDDGVSLPMAARRVIAEPRAARTAAVPPQQIRRDARFVEKVVLPCVPERLQTLPLAAGGRDVRPTLFVGVYGFF